MPERDPKKDALPLRSDLFKHASTLSTALAALAATFLVTGFKDIPSTAGRGFLAFSILAFMTSAIAGFLGLSNMAYHVRKGNYTLPFEAKFPLLMIYGSLIVGVFSSLVAILIFLATPAPSETPNKDKGREATPAPPGKALAETPANVPGKPNLLKEIYFEHDRYDLLPGALETLNSNAEWFRANSSIKVLIEGHTDDEGSVNYNLSLGAKRAQIARETLVNLGIPSQRVFTISYGKELPVCNDATYECRKKNRRVRFVIVNVQRTS